MLVIIIIFSKLVSIGSIIEEFHQRTTNRWRKREMITLNETLTISMSIIVECKMNKAASNGKRWIFRSGKASITSQRWSSGHVRAIVLQWRASRCPFRDSRTQRHCWSVAICFVNCNVNIFKHSLGPTLAGKIIRVVAIRIIQLHTNIFETQESVGEEKDQHKNFIWLIIILTL